MKPPKENKPNKAHNGKRALLVDDDWLVGNLAYEFLPHIFLYGTVGFEAEKAGKFFTIGAFIGMIGPSFRWNILNYGRIMNRVKAQNARFQQSLVNYRLTAVRALNEVNSVVTAYIKTQDQVVRLYKALGGGWEVQAESADFS